MSDQNKKNDELLSYKTLLKATETYVQEEMKQNDGSHDWHHVNRVRQMAVLLAHEKNQGNKEKKWKEIEIDSDTLLVIELSALLHDIKDWKYSGKSEAGVEAAIKFLQLHKLNPNLILRVAHTIQYIGFKTELSDEKIVMTLELAIVQDADRLDAMGAIGIARCFTYGGSKKRMLYNPDHVLSCSKLTQEEYVKQNANNNQSGILSHFYDKLLHLKDLMKTDMGRVKAEKRHQYMLDFLAQFHDEWNAQD